MWKNNRAAEDVQICLLCYLEGEIDKIPTVDRILLCTSLYRNSTDTTLHKKANYSRNIEGKALIMSECFRMHRNRSDWIDIQSSETGFSEEMS